MPRTAPGRHRVSGVEECEWWSSVLEAQQFLTSALACPEAADVGAARAHEDPVRPGLSTLAAIVSVLLDASVCVVVNIRDKPVCVATAGGDPACAPAADEHPGVRAALASGRPHGCLAGLLPEQRHPSPVAGAGHGPVLSVPVLSGAETVGVVVVRGSGRTAPHLPVASAIALLAGTLVAHQSGGPALHADPVTGLGNRATFDRRMAEVLGDPARDVAVLLLDLDRFKQVNDTLGYQAGDRLLVEVTRRLRAVVPEDTTIARVGGDEFVIVPPPGIGWIQVRRLAQAVIEVLRAPYAVAESSDLPACPASVGVTATSGRRASADELLREADLALHQAKGSGRDRYVVFDDVLRSRAQTRQRTERRLREALEGGLLTLQYQPIIDFVDGRVAGAEALVRVRDPDDGRLLTPEAFIAVAEETGLIVDLDCWVIDTALAQLAEWAARSTTASVPWVAINVSPRSMEHHRVVRRLLETVRTGAVPHDRIRIELTEHTFLGAVPAGESALRQLLGSGIRVGIDDFGTGYSALAYLQRFDLDFMKIDRSFVAAVGKDERADAVVTAIVDLAHAHGMLVTAEGVETPRQARRLREIGCDYAQGYHFGRPGDPDRVVRRQQAG